TGAAGAIAFVVLAAAIGTPFFRRHAGLLDAPRVRRSPFVLALGVCLGLAAAAEQVGLAALVGAFLAGMVLAETREQYELDRRMARRRRCGIRRRARRGHGAREVPGMRDRSERSRGGSRTARRRRGDDPARRGHARRGVLGAGRRNATGAGVRRSRGGGPRLLARRAHGGASGASAPASVRAAAARRTPGSGTRPGPGRIESLGTSRADAVRPRPDRAGTTRGRTEDTCTPPPSSTAISRSEASTRQPCGSSCSSPSSRLGLRTSF